MFSLFKSNTIKPKVTFKGTCKSYPVASSTHHLSDGLLLSIGVYEHSNKTEVILFNPTTHQKIKEVELEKKYRAVTDLPDNKILLRLESRMLCHPEYKKEQYNLVILDCHSLEIVEWIETPDKCELRTGWLLLENQRFATLDHSNRDNVFKILIHDLKTKIYNQPASSALQIDRSDNCAFAELRQLANGTFACRVLGSINGYFKVLLLERTPGAETEFNLTGTINPWERLAGSTPSGDFVELLNGDILTYHSSSVNFEIWRGTERVDHWHIKSYGKFLTSKVFPMPDGEHILISSGLSELLLFNMKTRHLQKVNLNGFIPYEVSISPEDQVVIRAGRYDSDDEQYHTLLVADFKKFLTQTKAEEYDSSGKYQRLCNSSD